MLSRIQLQGIRYCSAANECCLRFTFANSFINETQRVSCFSKSIPIFVVGPRGCDNSNIFNILKWQLMMKVTELRRTDFGYWEDKLDIHMDKQAHVCQTCKYSLNIIRNSWNSLLARFGHTRCTFGASYRPIYYQTVEISSYFRRFCLCRATCCTV